MDSPQKGIGNGGNGSAALTIKKDASCPDLPEISSANFNSTGNNGNSNNNLAASLTNNYYTSPPPALVVPSAQ